ncbi:MAG TPA: nucleoside deaminase [Candidatus Tectomicrobia bacterium]
MNNPYEEIGMEATATARDLQYLRHAIAFAATSRALGKHPFAALIVDAHGEVLAEAGNAFGWPNGDATGHAELLAVRDASQRFPPARLAQATLYSSAEPCAMCAGAVYWSGLGRVVYALSEARLLTLTGNHPENPTLALPCREVFARGQRAIVVIGPLLEDEAAVPHLGFWR